MSMGSCLDALAAEAERDLEVALRGSSLCSVSRRAGQGAADVKAKEGRWYALRDVLRGLERGDPVDEALRAAAETLRGRTPSGPAWDSYRTGGESALRDARACLGLAERD